MFQIDLMLSNFVSRNEKLKINLFIKNLLFFMTLSIINEEFIVFY